MIEHERLGRHEVAAAVEVRRDVAAQFIPLQLSAPEAKSRGAVSGEIVIDFAHHSLKASARWPLAQADRCAAWLREVMR
jgi:transposase